MPYTSTRDQAAFRKCLQQQKPFRVARLIRVLMSNSDVPQKVMRIRNNAIFSHLHPSLQSRLTSNNTQSHRGASIEVLCVTLNELAEIHGLEPLCARQKWGGRRRLANEILAILEAPTQSANTVELVAH
mgnify:CR=1 FL=1